MSEEGYERPAEATWGATPAFLRREKVETHARAAMRVESPWLSRVLSASPVVRYADPPGPARPERPLSLADAAVCALQLCDAVSRLNAEGWWGLDPTPENVRVIPEAAGWRVNLVVPHPPLRWRFGAALLRSEHEFTAGADTDVVAILNVLRDLVDGVTPPTQGFAPRLFEYLARPLPAELPPVFHATTTAPEAAVTFTDVAALAQALLPIAGSPASWTERVATMPRLQTLRRRVDWTLLTDLGERDVAEAHQERVRASPTLLFMSYPLAAAWHQRAGIAYEAGDLELALRCVARAIELDAECARYRVTEGSLLAARGDLPGAADAYSRSLEVQRTAEGFYGRAVTRHRLGDVEGANADLLAAAPSPAKTARMAASGAPPAELPGGVSRLIRQAQVAVSRAMIAKGDESARFLLANVLLILGRREEALTEARQALAEHPRDALARDHFARLFGAALSGPQESS